MMANVLAITHRCVNRGVERRGLKKRWGLEKGRRGRIYPAPTSCHLSLVTRYLSLGSYLDISDVQLYGVDAFPAVYGG